MPRRGVFNLDVVARVEIDGLSPSDLKTLVVRLLGEVADGSVVKCVEILGGVISG
ncbi:MAG: hypothetical protein ACP5QR_17765 [Rhizomicrobium sp.]